MTNTRSGGFLGDPREAFTPPAAGSCCGAAAGSPETRDGSAGCCAQAPASTADQAGDAASPGCCG